MGAQMALQGALLSVGMMVITRVINGFGANVVAAFTVGSNVQNLAVMLFSNFSFGFSVYVGQNFGARLAGRIRRGVREIFLLVGGLSVLASALPDLRRAARPALRKARGKHRSSRPRSASCASSLGFSRSSGGSGSTTAR